MTKEEIENEHKRLSDAFEDWLDMFQWNKVIITAWKIGRKHNIDWGLYDKTISFSIKNLNILLQINLLHINISNPKEDYSAIMNQLQEVQTLLYHNENVPEKVRYLHEPVVGDESMEDEPAFLYWELDEKRPHQ